MILKYRSGEEIKNGDRVLFHRQASEVEFVAGDPGDPRTNRYLQEFGGGVMISDPAVSGRTFIPVSQIGESEDLEFVSRAESNRG
jgi:hypothetical protein